MTRAEYVAAVERVRGHIYAGDIYQANLTQQISCAPREGDTPEQVFLRLRREHPASFAAFIRRALQRCQCLAERFMRVSPGGKEGRRAWRLRDAAARFKQEEARGCGGASVAREDPEKV